MFGQRAMTLKTSRTLSPFMIQSATTNGLASHPYLCPTEREPELRGHYVCSVGVRCKVVVFRASFSAQIPILSGDGVSVGCGLGVILQPLMVTQTARMVVTGSHSRYFEGSQVPFHRTRCDLSSWKSSFLARLRRAIGRRQSPGPESP